MAGNQALTDFASYQVTESLSTLNLDTADNDIITWSFDATAVQADMLAALTAHHPGRQVERAGEAERRPGVARQAAQRHRRDMDRGQENHGRDRGVSQPADMGTARLVNC